MKAMKSFSHERGVALAMVLMILVVLTILGVSAMKTSVLEVRMSGNVQDANSAFQAALSGLVAATSMKMDYYSTSTQTYTPSSTVSATVETSYNAMSLPPRGSGFSAIHYQVANFNQKSTATTTSGAQAIINQGMYQVVNK